MISVRLRNWETPLPLSRTQDRRAMLQNQRHMVCKDAKRSKTFNEMTCPRFPCRIFTVDLKFAFPLQSRLNVTDYRLSHSNQVSSSDSVPMGCVAKYNCSERFVIATKSRFLFRIRERLLALSTSSSMNLDLTICSCTTLVATESMSSSW